MRILGIDAGYANLAYCEIDTDDHRHPIIWNCCRILEGKYSEKAFFDAVYRWATGELMYRLFQRVDRIVLERQMTPKFAVINVVIRTLYFAKCVEHNPQTVGAYFRLPRDRTSKKKAAITLVSRNAALPAAKKKDDLADAYLLAIYEMQTHFGLLPEGLEDGRPGIHDDQPSPGRKRHRHSLSAAIPRPVDTGKRLFYDLTGSSSEGSGSSDSEGDEA